MCRAMIASAPATVQCVPALLAAGADRGLALGLDLPADVLGLLRAQPPRFRAPLHHARDTEMRTVSGLRSVSTGIERIESRARICDDHGMFPAEELQRRIVDALSGATVQINDMTGGQDHYRVRIVSDAFEGKSSLERHRMVYALVSDVMGGALHALSLDTLTHDEAGS